MDLSLLHGLPTKPGVYLYKNAQNKVIYVGKAKDLKKRVGSYFSGRPLDAKTSKLVLEAERIEHIVVGSEIEAFLLEANLIKKYKPYYNIQFSDDKYYPYLKLGKKPYPYIAVVRKKDDKSAVYLGPYVSSSDLKIVLKHLRRVFPYQSVKNHPNKKCLYFHLGLCPCVPVFPENLVKAKKNIKKIENFFRGKTQVVIKELLKEQVAAVKKEEFEEAGRIQKQIERIELMISEHYSPLSYEEKPGLYYERIKNELDSLSQILKKYGIVSTLKRIECYDISNIQGKNATGSMVVFENGDVSKSHYRKFRIKFKKTPDDFAMHMEVMARRVKHTDWEKPDLIVIDGGKGQISSVLKVLAHYNYNVPLIGLAKREETIVVPYKSGRGLDFFEVKLPHSTPGVNLLRRLRDEAHRFAITYHKLLRKKALNI